MFDTVFFDCDSTLICIESLDVLGERLGVGEEVRRLTELSMHGTVPIEKIFKQKVDLMAPSREDMIALAEICRRLLVPGACEAITALHRAGKRVFLVSSNFHPVVDAVAEELGIPQDHVFANEMHFDEQGAYCGINETLPLCRSNGKGAIVRHLLREGERSAFVGDGANDASTRGILTSPMQHPHVWITS